MKREGFSSYLRTCRKCNEGFKTKYKNGKVCGGCSTSTHNELSTTKVNHLRTWGDGVLKRREYI